MKRTEFEALLENNTGIRLNEEYVLFNDLELYSFVTEKKVKFKSFDDVYKHVIVDNSESLTIGDIIEKTEEFEQEFDGGRGSGSSNSEMGGGFNHANGPRGKDLDEVKYPAEFNINTKFKTYDQALKLFRKKYKDADTEYGITVDEQGFVHQHIKGGKTSVGISGNKGEMVIHNHPSGGNFSDTDLISTALTSAKGVVATGSKGTYTFTKTHKFKAKEFVKAIKKAKWPTHMSYDEGADWWLRKNAKAYGYTYSRRK